MAVGNLTFTAYSTRGFGETDVDTASVMISEVGDAIDDVHVSYKAELPDACSGTWTTLNLTDPRIVGWSVALSGPTPIDGGKDQIGLDFDVLGVAPVAPLTAAPVFEITCSSYGTHIVWLSVDAQPNGATDQDLSDNVSSAIKIVDVPIPTATPTVAPIPTDTPVLTDTPIPTETPPSTSTPAPTHDLAVGNLTFTAYSTRGLGETDIDTASVAISEVGDAIDDFHVSYVAEMPDACSGTWTSLNLTDPRIVGWTIALSGPTPIDGALVQIGLDFDVLGVAPDAPLTAAPVFESPVHRTARISCGSAWTRNRTAPRTKIRPTTCPAASR